MPLPYPIRPARQADLASLNAIEQAAEELFPPGRIPQPDTMPVAELARALDDGLLWVATDEDAAAGFAMARVHAPVLHLYLLAVHPAHGRRGVGARLLETVLAEAARRGLSGVTLTTFADLPWNGPFYARMGFRPVPEAELTPMLREILSREAAAGLTNRVAMHFLHPT